MKALITGGAGFIGSHIAEALCRKGASVILLDDLSLGNPANISSWKQANDSVDLVEGSITDADLLGKLMPGVDWVFHEGAMPSVPRSVAQPLESNEINTDGTLKVLIAARDAKVKRLLFASSSAIYGDSDAPYKVETLPPAPLSPYGLQKYAGERYCQLFHQLYGFETVALRYFNVFGPRQAFDSPYSGVIAKFCTAMLAGQAPTIFGDGLQARDFTYIDNVVAANIGAVEAPAEKVAGRVFNIAAGKRIDLIKLVDDLNTLSGQQIAPKFEPPRMGDIKFSLADISAAEQAFGYAAKVEWLEGLSRTLDFYRQQQP